MRTRQLARPPIVRSRRLARLRVEGMEDRSVPATFTVTTPLDVVDAGDGLMSLREGVLAANALPGADTISLPAGEYVLTIAGAGEDLALTGDLDVLDELTVVGAGSGLNGNGEVTRISAQHGDRKFDVHSSTLSLAGLVVSGDWTGEAGSSLRATDSALSATNCQVDGLVRIDGGFAQGGGILAVNSDIRLVNSFVVGTAFAHGGSAAGGAVYQDGGSLQIVGCSLNGSSVDASLFAAGAVFTRDTAVQIANSSFRFNQVTAPRFKGYGAGLYASGGTLDLRNSEFEGNHFFFSGGSGGAIYLTGCTARLANSELRSNFATLGGAVYMTGSDVEWTGLRFRENAVTGTGVVGVNYVAGHGGAVFSADGSLSMSRTHFLNNSGDGDGFGGGLYVAGGTVTALHCTFEGCFAGRGGGAYIAGGTATILNSAFVGNTAFVGGGLFIEDDATVCLDQKTLDAFADNLAHDSHPDIFGPFTVC